jgi:hypothetical protein
MGLSLVHANATLHWEGWKDCVQSWKDTALFKHPIYEVYRKPIMAAYQEVFENTTEDILCYAHDDVTFYEPDWDVRVMREFKDSTVGAVGFFGAKGHGLPSLYLEPCKPENFMRRGVVSNLRRDAERHGMRFAGECDVAVFDGLTMFVRREVIRKMGGWPQNAPCSYWVYDYLISCEVRRQGLRNRFVGVDCDHWNGKSPSIIPEDHSAAHQWLYDRYKDVLPYTVEG